MSITSRAGSEHVSSTSISKSRVDLQLRFGHLPAIARVVDELHTRVTGRKLHQHRLTGKTIHRLAGMVARTRSNEFNGVSSPNIPMLLLLHVLALICGEVPDPQLSNHILYRRMVALGKTGCVKTLSFAYRNAKLPRSSTLGSLKFLVFVGY